MNTRMLHHRRRVLLLREGRRGGKYISKSREHQFYLSLLEKSTQSSAKPGDGYARKHQVATTIASILRQADRMSFRKDGSCRMLETCFIGNRNYTIIPGTTDADG